MFQQQKLFLLTAILGISTSAAVYADEETLASEFQSWIGNTTPDQEDWSLHAQANDIYQGYPSFHASYSGGNSLSPHSQEQNMASATLFLGRRLWDGAEAYYNPELYEGGGLSQNLGIAGFPNGEAIAPSSYPFKVGTGRLFLRQTFGLGGDTEKIAAGQNQLATIEDVNRITVTIGKLSLTDLFDTNSYSNGARTQFLNWALLNSAAWDIPSDQRGYDYGGAIEFNQESWTLRYGMALEPKNLGASNLEFHGLNNLAQVAELEERYKMDDKPGKTHFLVFYNRDQQAYFTDALNQGGDINEAIDQDRKYGHSKYGFAINAEQQVTDSIGAFARLSWNNGKTEDWTYTQVDESFAAGLSITGKSWGRDDDVWGIAGVINGLSADQKRAVEQGYLGANIGDGMLNYAPEMIIETYYAFKLNQYATLSPDYQFVDNPGYNTDRGPVNIFALRLHLEF